MNLLAPVAISISTFEIVEGKINPVLTHIFWGETLDQAYGYAKSHLITDYFFSSSFIGQMNWKGSILTMTNSGEIISNVGIFNANQVILQLAQEAQKINSQQSGIALLIQQIGL